jgi:hypothetical protein
VSSNNSRIGVFKEFYFELFALTKRREVDLCAVRLLLTLLGFFLVFPLVGRVFSPSGDGINPKFVEQ